MKADWDLAAEGWRACWPVLERNQQPVSDRLVDLAQVHAGDVVLDIATGVGEPALTAARRVGRSGRVIAIDQSEAVMDVARERAAAVGVTNVEFRCMDAGSIDLPGASIDAIVSTSRRSSLSGVAATALRLMSCCHSSLRSSAASQRASFGWNESATPCNRPRSCRPRRPRVTGAPRKRGSLVSSAGLGRRRDPAHDRPL